MNSNNNTLFQYLNALAKCSPDKKLLGDASGWLTVKEVQKKVLSIGHQLSLCGIKPGDYIALHSERTMETILAILAIRMVGAIALLTDPHHTPEICIGECPVPIPFHAVMSQHSADCFHLRRGTITNSILINETDTFELPSAILCDGNQPGFVIFTSGSSGKSRAVVLCDQNIINNLLDSDPFGDYQTDDIALGAIPLEHIFGLVLAMGTVVHGYSIYFPPRTDVDSLLKAIDNQKITRMNGVPSLYLAMTEISEKYCLDSLRVGFIGGAPATKAQYMYIEKALGMTLVPVYGMSECIGISCADHREPASIRLGNVGRFYPRNTVRILLEDGSVAAPMQEGEICVNGPFRMLGYWPNRMDEKELLHTGDLGYVDDNGYLILSGRKKDIIIRNGKNISPKKIEEAILSLAEVSAATVVGLPDEKVGEVPYAMVVGIMDPSDLKELLPKNELPAGIMCVDNLPLTASGKPDKQKIKEVLISWKNG